MHLFFPRFLSTFSYRFEFFKNYLIFVVVAVFDVVVPSTSL